MNARWRVLTPIGAAGAVGVVGVEGDLEGAWARLGLRPMRVGEAGLRNLLGVDRGVVVRWSETCVHLMPHGGTHIVREIGSRLTRLGIEPARGEVGFPEAADEIEARVLGVLGVAASPLAVSLLLEQPRRWRANGTKEGGRGCAPRVLGRLIEPPVVAVMGPSNIGKSTLVNALAGRTVSVVADEPGTTRDHVGVMVEVGGLVVRVVDTAGIRLNATREEAEAAEVAGEIGRRAELVLLCGDVSARPVDVAGVSGDVIRVGLRSDLGEVGWGADLVLSVRGGRGLEELAALVRERLVPAAAIADPRPWKFWEL